MAKKPTPSRPSEYLESWANELQSRASRVRQLIGSAHWLSDGFQKESILRSFLSRHLPGSLSISRGFVAPLVDQTVSPEIDILIASAEAGMFWLNESDLLIVPPASVKAHIHVKTTLRVIELLDALKGVSAASVMCKPTTPDLAPWSGVFFFTGEQQSIQWKTRTLINGVKTAAEEGKTLPHCLAVLDGPLAIIEPPEEENGTAQSRIRIYDLKKLSPAGFLVDLFVHLTTTLLPTYRTDAEELLVSTGGTLIEESSIYYGRP